MTVASDDGCSQRRRLPQWQEQPEPETAAVVTNSGGRNGGSKSQLRSRATTSPAAVNGDTRVHEANACVDLILRAELNQDERPKVETLESPQRCYSHVSIFPHIIVPPIESLLGLDRLTVVLLKKSKNIGYAWLGSSTT